MVTRKSLHTDSKYPMGQKGVVFIFQEAFAVLQNILCYSCLFLDLYSLTTALNSLFITERGSCIIYFEQRFITDKHSKECTFNFKLKLALHVLATYGIMIQLKNNSYVRVQL